MATVCGSTATQSLGDHPVALEHTMTTIAAMNPQTRDPLIRLPYETWLQCLSLATYYSPDGPLPYLAVSQHWSETIISSPALWTQIIIYTGEDEEARLHTFLHLSGSQLLDVACFGDVPARFLQLLAQSRMRIRCLIVDQYGSTTVPILLWGSLGNPNMRRLAIMSPTDSIAHALIPTCPDLRSLRSSNFIEESMIAVTLEEVGISIQNLADLEPLYKCTHLRSLTLRRDIINSTLEPESRNHFLQLSSHLGPHLVDLDVELSLEEFIVFIPYMPSFVALYSAALTVSMPAEELTSRITTPFPTQGTLNLRVFSLNIHARQFREKLSVHRDTWGHILDYFFKNRLLQHLHTFRYDAETIPVEPARIASLLRCLPNVRVLDLIFEAYETNIGSNHPPIHMPNLLQLSLMPISWIVHIEAPNLLHLSQPEYRFEYRYANLHLIQRFGINISYLIVNEAISKAISEAYAEGVGPRFESLRTIQITTASTVEWLFHLSSIRIIDFAYGTTSRKLNTFFLDLLRHPGTLPNLSTIKIHRFPSWELLFEVLRRRNAAKMHRIQELVLPSFPVLTILSRAIKLLQGHTEVYTNRDIDEVIYKRCQDKSFDDTCEYCLYSGYINCFKSVSLDGPCPEPLPGEDGPVDLLTLESTKHIDEDGKFRGWSDWETLANEPLHSVILSGTGRVKVRCSRFLMGDAIISEYTLFDIPLPTNAE